MLAVSALGFVAAACPDEGGDDGSAVSELCAEQAAVAECDVAEGCLWDPDHDMCIVDCASIEDRGACLDTDECFWDGRSCFYGAI
jgi:hypothetical protein